MPVDEFDHVSQIRADVHNILVVDDDAEHQKTLKKNLEEKGHKVITAKDGGQAHSAFRMRQPDFVLAEIILPGESGFELCEHMKQLNDSIPIMMLTVIDMDDSRALADRIGADGYMTKPYDFEKLLSTIYSIAERNWQKVHKLTPAHSEDGMVRFRCSSCDTKIKVKAVHRGRHMTCPKCMTSVMVPRHD